MKKLYSLILLATGCIIVSCKKENINSRENGGIVGKWKLTETFTTDQNGVTNWQKVGEHASSLLEFKANGDFSEIKGLIYSSINVNNTYKLLNDSTIILSVKDSVSFPHKTKWLYSELTPEILVINPGCIAPCGAKYIPVK